MRRRWVQAWTRVILAVGSMDRWVGGVGGRKEENQRESVKRADQKKNLIQRGCWDFLNRWDREGIWEQTSWIPHSMNKITRRHATTWGNLPMIPKSKKLFLSFFSRWLRVLRTTVSENGWRAKEGVRRVSRKSRHDLWSDSWTDICSAAISRQRATACLLEQDTVENVDKYGNEPVKSSISRNTRDPKRDEEASTSTNRQVRRAFWIFRSY